MEKLLIHEHKPWYCLPGTGFNVKLQIDQLEDDLSSGVTLDQSFQKIEQDIQGFKIEYLCEGLLFPIVLGKQQVEGQERIVAPLYNNKLLVDTVTEQERSGAVKKSVKAVEEFLLSAPQGSIAIMTSPDGWSGYDGITYQDSQTYIWQVGTADQIQGFTVRTDMSLAQNRELLNFFGQDLSDCTLPKEQIIETVSKPVLIRHYDNQKAWNFQDVVDVIKHIKKSPYAYKNRYFSEIYASLKNPQALWTLDQITKRLTEKLKQKFKKILSNGYTRVIRIELEKSLGIAVLELAQSIRHPSKTLSEVEGSQILREFEEQESAAIPYAQIAAYEEILYQVQQLPGCAGGGQTKTIFEGTLTPREITKSKLPQAEKILSCVKCPFCEIIVNAIIAGGKIYCPSCENSVAYSG